MNKEKTKAVYMFIEDGVIMRLYISQKNRRQYLSGLEKGDMKLM